MTKSASNPTVDELEVKLATELKHTLKLVPESQRELFVFELARWYSRERTAAQTELLDEFQAILDKGTWTSLPDRVEHLIRTYRTKLTGEDKDNE
jgi:hypothetical protein